MQKFLRDYPGALVLAVTLAVAGVVGSRLTPAARPSAAQPTASATVDAEAQAEAQKEAESLALIAPGARDNLALVCPGERVGYLANAIRMSSNWLVESSGVSVHPNKYALMVMEAKNDPATSSFSCDDLINMISEKLRG